jgi:hypothetical protein
LVAQTGAKPARNGWLGEAATLARVTSSSVPRLYASQVPACTA